jgi:predicted XRE-type DNA-binding protein
MKRKPTIVPSSGNVFKDLGLASPDEELAKAEMTARIAEAISRKGLTQTAAAKILGVDQPKVSALLRGKFAGFSIERLLKFIAILGNDIEIVIRPRSKGKGHIHVRMRRTG